MVNNCESELIRKLQKGENEAWKNVIKQHYKALVFCCGRYVNSWDEAKDLVHDTILKAMKNIPKFNASRYTSMRPWLWQIARNTALDHLKSRKIREGAWQSIRPTKSATTQSYLKIIDRRPSPRTQADENDRSRLLFSCLEKLDERFSEVIFLHYMDGLTRKQIAETLDIPENTVKSRLRIGLGKVREMLQMNSIE